MLSLVSRGSSMLPPTLEGAMSTGHRCMLQIWSCVWNIGGSFCEDAVGQGLGVAVVWWDTRERERETLQCAGNKWRGAVGSTQPGCKLLSNLKLRAKKEEAH